MKRILLFTALFGLLGLWPTAANGHAIKGSGVRRTETRQASGYTAIEVSRGIVATLTEAPAGTLTIEADEKIIDYIRTTVNADGVLRLTVDREITNLFNCYMHITVPTPAVLTRLAASSGARVTTQTVAEVSTLDIRASSGAEIEIACRGGGCVLHATSGAEIKANLNVDRCAAEATSGAEIAMRGTADKCRISVSSGASCKARNLQTGSTEARASSGGSIRITCTETLKAEATSGGSIAYWGGCRLENLKNNRSGIIRKKD